MAAPALIGLVRGRPGFAFRQAFVTRLAMPLAPPCAGTGAAAVLVIVSAPVSVATLPLTLAFLI